MSVASISVRGVTLVVKVRMLPTEAEAVALQATLLACNTAASWLSAVMHAGRVHRKHDAQKRFYTDLRERFGLAAQPAIRVIGKVADAYAALRANLATLGAFLAYKAKQAGVAFVEVDPAYTSQTCPACGWVDKRNRRSQAAFECVRCDFVGHADHNAAINIATRGVKRWGEVMHPHAASTLTAS
jgi:transposase